jgi:hypothetical protein
LIHLIAMFITPAGIVADRVEVRCPVPKQTAVVQRRSELPAYRSP